MGNYFSYMRISTKEERARQKYTRQEKALETYAKNNHIKYFRQFREDVSGKSFLNRAEWQELEEGLHPGDTIVFKDICRFSREVDNGFQKYVELMDKGINLIFLDNPTLNTDYMKNLLHIADQQDRIARESTQFISRILLIAELDRAERERLNIVRRTKDGMAARKQAAEERGEHWQTGPKRGTTYKLTDELRSDILLLLADRNMKMVDVMRRHHISRNTLKKYMEQVKDTL
jgi:DNA invertase Pin-like site-specific DNA recombinase